MKKQLTPEQKKQLGADTTRFLTLSQRYDGEYDVDKFCELAMASGYKVTRTGQQVVLEFFEGKSN